jgi:hypothetical protein
MCAQKEKSPDGTISQEVLMYLEEEERVNVKEIRVGPFQSFPWAGAFFSFSDGWLSDGGPYQNKAENASVVELSFFVS